MLIIIASTLITRQKCWFTLAVDWDGLKYWSIHQETYCHYQIYQLVGSSDLKINTDMGSWRSFPSKVDSKPPKQLCFVHLKSVGLIPFIRFPLPFISFIMFSPHQDLTKNPSKIHDFVGGFGFQLDAQTNSTSATRTNGRWSHGRCFLAETDVGQLWEGCFWNFETQGLFDI